MVQEMRIVLRNVGKINPEVIDDYLREGGYQALTKAKAMEPAAIITELERSGRLRGRGGAGFNTGLKWRSAFHTQADQKYIICNADEGEPGTYKDRIILEHDPHTVIEGMAIAAYAIGATEGFIYCRAEYSEISSLLEHAVKQAEEKGLLAGLKLHVVCGAGAYVCGEETALIESIEGKRGEPRLKPPYPTVSGLWGKPTVVNNVETFAAVPVILDKGAGWFSRLGAEKYPGTKIFCLSGDVKNRTWCEVPTDTSLRAIIEDIGGGMRGSEPLKAVQVGGSSCPFLTPDKLDTSVDFDSMSVAGAALGSGSIFVMDASRSMVDVTYSITRFFQHESCGKCLPCREGTMRLAALAEGIAGGTGSRKDLETIRELGTFMNQASFCPLGQSAAVPVFSALAQFEEDFRQRIMEEEGECK